MGRVTVIANDEQFALALQQSSGLLVVDYTASWCGPCQMMAPIFERLSDKYPAVTFLKVDIDVCKGVRQAMQITAMPTFHFFQKVEAFTGADAAKLEEVIVRLSSGASGASGGPVVLNEFINQQAVECLNQSSAHSIANAFTDSDTYLESDCDEQLLITVGFRQPVKLHALRIVARNPDQAPKTIKLFVNLPSPLDFDNADRTADTQTLVLSPADIKGNTIPLKLVKYQNVNTVTLFVRDNQGEADTTVVHTIQFIGEPRDATNMADFKRVAGQKGEVDH